MAEKVTAGEMKKGEEIGGGLFAYEFALGAKENPFFKRYENFTYTVYSRSGELSHEQVKKQLSAGKKSIITTDGLCSNAKQWRHDGSSVIQAIAESVGEDALILSVSGPGFGGSKLSDEMINQQTVSTESYREQMREFVKEMGINSKRAVLAGHSMAAEMAAGMSEEFGQVVLLNPAVHLGMNKEFVAFSVANQAAILGDWIGKKEDWVDPIIGGITRLMVGAEKDSPQNVVHGEEVKNNFWAYVAKCRELAKKDDYQISLKDPSKVHILFGGGDILTPAKDARAWFIETLKHNEVANPDQALVQMENWLDGHDLSGVPHDGVMFTPDLAKVVGGKIGELSRGIVVEDGVSLASDHVSELVEVEASLAIERKQSVINLADILPIETYERLSLFVDQLKQWHKMVEQSRGSEITFKETRDFMVVSILTASRFNQKGVNSLVEPVTETAAYQQLMGENPPGPELEFWGNYFHRASFGEVETDVFNFNTDDESAYEHRRRVDIAHASEGMVEIVNWVLSMGLSQVGMERFMTMKDEMVATALSRWDLADGVGAVE